MKLKKENVGNFLVELINSSQEEYFFSKKFFYPKVKCQLKNWCCNKSSVLCFPLKFVNCLEKKMCTCVSRDRFYEFKIIQTSLLHFIQPPRMFWNAHFSCDEKSFQHTFFADFIFSCLKSEFEICLLCSL